MMRHIAIKLGAALLLSFIWTFLLAYLLYDHFLYRADHLALDLCYSFLMFYLFYEGYAHIISYLDRYFPKWHAEKYLLGLITFKLYSLVVFILVGLIPSKIFLGGVLVSPLSEATGFRLNFIMLVLVSAIYYVILTSFHIFRNIHQASLQAEKMQKEIAQAQFDSLKN